MVMTVPPAVVPEEGEISVILAVLSARYSTASAIVISFESLCFTLASHL